MKHTPGPWKVDSSNPEMIVKLKNNVYLIIADCQSDLICQEEYETNARLIAAAPDLLGALKNMLRVYYGTGIWYRPEYEKAIAEECEQAIAKAERKEE